MSQPVVCHPPRPCPRPLIVPTPRRDDLHPPPSRRSNTHTEGWTVCQHITPRRHSGSTDYPGDTNSHQQTEIGTTTFSLFRTIGRMVACNRSGRPTGFIVPVGGGTAGVSRLCRRRSARKPPAVRTDCKKRRRAYQNFRFFLTASRFSSWMCSVSGISFGQTFVQENWV